MLDNSDTDEEGIRLLEMLRATYETPEARADAAARTLMSSLMQPIRDAQHFDEVAPSHKSKGLREYYGFLDARSALQIKSKVDKS